MDTSRADYENTEFQEFERIVIYDIKDGSPELLTGSLKRLVNIVAELPPDRDTRAMWLYDKEHSGPRLGMLYWLLWDDERPDPADKLVTRNVSTANKRYGDNLTVITCECITDVPDGSVATLLENAITEVSKLKLKRLDDISFSKVGVDDFMEKIVLKLYCH